MTLFDADLMLEERGDARFEGVVSDNWSVSGNPNGGYLMAMMANAMARVSDNRETPIITANYLSRCVPGKAEIRVSEIARSRRFSRFEACLYQEGAEKIRALGTFVSDDHDSDLVRYETQAPELPPADACVPMPRLSQYTLFHNVDLRLDPACAGWVRGGPLADVSINAGYLSFRDGRAIDFPAVFLMIDAMPPAVMATQGITAWVPTIELSVNVRNLPRTPRVRCSLRTRFITRGLLEADGELWDDEGNLAAISRQIAQFKKG